MAGPILVNPGQTVGSGDWDALTQQHGGIPSPGQPLPMDDPNVIKLLQQPGMGAYLHQSPVYRYYFADGTYVDAYTDENGQDSHIVDYKPSSRFTQQHPASGTAAGGTNTSIGTNPVSGKPTQVTTYPDGRPPTYDDTQVPAAQAAQGQTTTTEGTQRPDGTWDNTQPREVVRRADGALVSSKPLEGQALAAWQQQNQTGSAEEPVPSRPGWVQITTKKGGNSAVTFRGPDGKEVPTLPADNKPTQAADGSWGYWDQSGGPPKWTTISGGPAGKKYSEVKQDPTTGAWSGLTLAGTWEPIQGGPGVAGNQPLPPNMPPFRPDPNKPALGLIEYVQQLTALHSQKGENGAPLLTDAQFSQFVELAHQQVTAEASRLDTITRVQQQQQANEISQRATDMQASTSRLNAANTATQAALDTSLKMASAFTPQSYAKLGGPILPSVIAQQDQRAQAWGGLDSPARIGTGGYPALQQTAQMGIQPQSQAAVPAAPMVPPNAIGAGAVSAPGGAPGAPPLLGPRPMATAPVAPSAVQGQPAPAMPGAPPVQMTAEQAADYSRRGINPSTGEPTGLPPAPVNPLTSEPVPGQPVPAAANPNAPVGMAPPQQGGVLPASLGFGVIANMLSSGKYPADVVHEAARQLGMM